MESLNLKTITLATAMLFLIGCSSAPPRTSYEVSKPSSPLAKKTVLETAQTLIGTPYRYGGRSPRQGFDCSGLVYYTHLKAGRVLPRTSQAQYTASKPVARKALQPGDVVFFRIHRYKISHVGIYVGDNQFIHAPSSGKSVSIGDMDDPYWEKRFVRGGRFF